MAIEWCSPVKHHPLERQSAPGDARQRTEGPLTETDPIWPIVPPGRLIVQIDVKQLAGFPGLRDGMEEVETHAVAHVVAGFQETASPLRSTHVRDPEGPAMTFTAESFIDEITGQFRGNCGEPVKRRAEPLREPGRLRFRDPGNVVRPGRLQR